MLLLRSYSREPSKIKSVSDTCLDFGGEKKGKEEDEEGQSVCMQILFAQVVE